MSNTNASHHDPSTLLNLAPEEAHRRKREWNRGPCLTFVYVHVCLESWLIFLNKLSFVLLPRSTYAEANKPHNKLEILVNHIPLRLVDRVRFGDFGGGGLCNRIITANC